MRSRAALVLPRAQITHPVAAFPFSYAAPSIASAHSASSSTGHALPTSPPPWLLRGSQERGAAPGNWGDGRMEVLYGLQYIDMLREYGAGLGSLNESGKLRRKFILKNMYSPSSTMTYSSASIGPYQFSKAEKAELKVKVRLNIHGIVSLESATMLEEEVEVPVSATSEVLKDATKMDRDDATVVNMQESKGPADTAEGATGDGAQDSDKKSVPMDTDAKVFGVAKSKITEKLSKLSFPEIWSAPGQPWARSFSSHCKFDQARESEESKRTADAVEKMLEVNKEILKLLQDHLLNKAPATAPSNAASAPTDLEETVKPQGSSTPSSSTFYPAGPLGRNTLAVLSVIESSVKVLQEWFPKDSGGIGHDIAKY